MPIIGGVGINGDNGIFRTFNKRVGVELLGGVVAIPKQRVGRRPEKSE